MAATSEELASQAEQLQHAIAYFKIGETETQPVKRGQTPRKKAEIAHLKDRRKFKSLHEKANGKHEVSEKTEEPKEVPGDHLDEEFERY